MELAKRGSLLGLLAAKDIVLPPYLRVSFARDAAAGMTFLHNLRPPRVWTRLVSHRALVHLLTFLLVTCLLAFAVIDSPGSQV